jgi:hypothetical protein
MFAVAVGFSPACSLAAHPSIGTNAWMNAKAGEAKFHLVRTNTLALFISEGSLGPIYPQSLAQDCVYFPSRFPANAK